MSDQPSAKAQWNYAAVMAFLVVLLVNGFAGAGWLLGKITWEQWAAATMTVNGPVLGWIGRMLWAPVEKP